MKPSDSNSWVPRLVRVLAFVCVASAIRAQAAEETFPAGGTNVVTGTRRAAEVLPDKVPANARSVMLRVGEIKEIFQFRKPATAAETAFYLPIEGTSVVQLIIEERSGRVTYFLRGISPGKTVGGVVQRAWLDEEGFFPRNLADEARIQKAVKTAPCLISVLGSSGETKGTAP